MTIFEVNEARCKVEYSEGPNETRSTVQGEDAFADDSVLCSFV